MGAGKREHAAALRGWANLLATFSDPAVRVSLLEQELPAAVDLIRQKRDWWQGAAVCDRLIALELLLLKQAGLDPLTCSDRELQAWIEQLADAERFYDRQGGLVGYQAELLEHLWQEPTSQASAFLQPPFRDLQCQTPELWRLIKQGLEALPQCAELYPIGGAGDRLGLKDPTTGEFLPVALLQFDRKTLLQGLIDDLFAREWLYYRIFGQQVTCPIAMMTSQEKENDAKIRAFCHAMSWFGRGSENFTLFTQPLVPVIDPEGDWIQLPTGQVLLKPGGHGVIWRLMQEKGVVNWLFDHHAHLILVRQINNPLAASDRNLLALVGIGLDEGKVMGFASCPRVVGAAEGMNVVRMTLEPSGPVATLTNVEYTDFTKVGWRDEPTAPGSPYSAFPSNTNILFLNLQKALVELPELPVSGTILNLKPAQIIPENSDKRVVGRLESTMQNLADHLGTPISQKVWHEHVEHQQLPLPDLKVFCTRNERNQTLSATKRMWREGEPLLETPQGAYLDLLSQRLEVLRSAGWLVPDQQGPHPVAQVYWHPALGPLHALVRQKLQRGKLDLGSELVLNVAEAVCHDLEIQGSLIVEADHPLGPRTQEKIQFAPSCGQLYLQGVKVRNLGADRDSPGWDATARPKHLETCRIVLRGASRFIARDVIFRGDVRIEVADGEMVEAIPDLSSQGYVLIRRSWKDASWLTELTWQDNAPHIQLLIGAPITVEALVQ
jgi:hypothetical protein